MSAVNLATWLQIDADRAPERLAVVEGPQGPIGLLAHRVLGFRALNERDLARDYTGAGGAGERFLMGMTNDLIAILDVERLLADEELVVGAA